jgi:hypothetical protein
MKRDVSKLEKLRDPLREAVGLPLGLDGAYFVAGEIPTNYKAPTIVDHNEPPKEQPGLWCFWEPTGDGESYTWKYGEKNYVYKIWLEYLIAHFFKPWHYQLSGRIECDYYFHKYVSKKGDDGKEDEVRISYVETSELIINDDNIVIENELGTFKLEEE